MRTIEHTHTYKESEKKTYQEEKMAIVIKFTNLTFWQCMTESFTFLLTWEELILSTVKKIQCFWHILLEESLKGEKIGKKEAETLGFIEGTSVEYKKREEVMWFKILKTVHSFKTEESAITVRVAVISSQGQPLWQQQKIMSIS